jgi:hypothetical protein
MFLCDKVLNVIEDRLIFDLILHESLLQRGCDRNGQALMLRPPETAVNRYSGKHNDSGLGCQNKENVLGTIRSTGRGSGSSGLFRLFGLFSLSCSGSEINKNDQPIPSHSCHQL